MARSQHEQKEPELSREVKEKLAAKARTADRRREARPDSGCSPARLQDKVFDPLDGLALEPTMIAAQTTEQRADHADPAGGRRPVGQPHAAAPGPGRQPGQLPDPPVGDQQRGRAAGVGRPHLHAARAFPPRRPLPQPARHPTDDNPDHDDVSITFAPKDAVRVRCADGRVELSVSIAKLAKGERSWKNFQVRAFYRPRRSTACAAELVRDGIIQLSGQRLQHRRADRAAGHLLPRFLQEDALEPHARADDQRSAGFRDLAITQFVIDDGWIGVALGVRRVAARPPLLRR